MTFRKFAIIAVGLVLAAATVGQAQAANSPYLPYTGHGGLDIVTDPVDPETTGSIVDPGCSIYLPYSGHGGLDIVADCDPITTGSIEPAETSYLPYTGHGGLDIVE